MRAAAGAAGFALLVVAFWFGGIVAHFTAHPTTGYSRDLYAQFFPRYLYQADALSHGRIPLWNPHDLCGSPLLAGAQSGVFDPFAALVFVAVPPGAALHVYFLVHLLLTGGATYLLCRRGLELSWQGAVLAAVAWTLSPALTRSIYHPNRISCVAWLPVVFWLADALLRRPDLPRAGLLALALAAQACAGYPELALDTGLLVAVFAIVRLLGAPERAHAPRILAALAASAVLGVALAGVQLVPTVELLRDSARAALTANPTLTPSPRILGTLFGLRRDVGFAYLGMLPALYVGALPLVLVAAALGGAGPRFRGAYLACAGACAAAVVGYRHLHALPIYRLTRFSLPWALMLPFFTAVLAGMAWDGIVRPGARSRWVPVAIAGVGFVVFGTREAVLFALAAIALVAAAPALRAPAASFALALVVLVADLFHGLPYAAGTDPYPPLPRSETTTRLLAALDDDARELRFLGSAEAYTGVAVTTGTRTITGLDDSVMPRRVRRLVDHFNLGIAAEMPLRLDRVVASRPLLDLMSVAYVTGPARWADALATAGMETVVAPAAGRDGLWRNGSAVRRAFLTRGTRVVRDEDEAFRAVTSPAFRPADEAVLEAPLDAPLPPVAVGAAEGARVVADTGEEVHVVTTAARPALLVMSDTYLTGWEVRVDDVPAALLRADFAFRAVPVPAGRHTVTFAYRPPGFRLGVLLSLGGLAVLTAIAARTVRRRARTGGATTSRGDTAAAARATCSAASG